MWAGLRVCDAKREEQQAREKPGISNGLAGGRVRRKLYILLVSFLGDRQNRLAWERMTRVVCSEWC